MNGEVSRIMPRVGNISLNGSSEHLIGNFFPSTSFTFGVAPTPALPSEDMITSQSNGSGSTRNSSVCADANLNARVNSRWTNEEIPRHLIPSARTISAVSPSYHIVGCSELELISSKSTMNFDQSYGYFAPRNELSLSLGSAYLSEVSCSGVAQDAGGIHFSHAILASTFLHALQEILSEIASYAVEDLDGANDQAGESEYEINMSLSSSCLGAKGIPVTGTNKCPFSSLEVKCQSYMDHPQEEENNMGKSELITMLQANHSELQERVQCNNPTSTSIYLGPFHDQELQTLPKPSLMQVKRPHARYPTLLDSWPMHILLRDRRGSNGSGFNGGAEGAEKA